MKSQRGATLAIALLLLFIITILGVSTIQVSKTQEKMAANFQDKELSFNAAESGLSAGESWILLLIQKPIEAATCTSLPCVHETYQNINFVTQSSNWWQTNGAAFSSSLNNIATPPRYTIELLRFVPDTLEVGNSSTATAGVTYYRVTTHATGASNNSISIIQSTVARRF